MRLHLRRTTAVMVVAALSLLPQSVTSAAPAAGSAASAARSAPVHLVRPGDDALRFEGRWDVTRSTATTVNTGSRVFLRFSGGQVHGRFSVAGLTMTPYVYAVVDGVKSAPIAVDRGRIRLTPRSLRPGTHTLVLEVKNINEGANRWRAPFQSALLFKGFDLPRSAAVLRAPAASSLRFTFLGDSITQGVGAHCFAAPECEDGTVAYPRLTADAFGAAVEQVGFGAQGILKGGGGGVPPALAALRLNYAGSAARPWRARVVVINQGTNDMVSPAGVCLFPPSPDCEPTTESFETAYRRYLQAVMKRYPAAHVLALQPLGFGGVVSTLGPAIKTAVGGVQDPRVHYVSTRGWLDASNFSDQIHPNSGGHFLITQRLVTAITRLTGLRP